MAALANHTATDLGWRVVLMEMLAGVKAAVQRFPVPALLLLLAMIQANLVVADINLFGQGDDGFALDDEVVAALIGGALAALAAVLFGEAHRLTTAMRSMVALVVGIVAAALLILPRTFLVTELALLPALLALVPVAPFIGRGGSGSFWMFSARVAFAGGLGVLALLLFAGGISALLASLTMLFGIRVSEDLYQHIWAFTGLFAAPLFAMGQIPDRFDEEPGDAASSLMDRGMRALGDFIAAPLLIVYAVILHLYALKIVATGQVPEGQIGWLVLVYGLCIFGALLVINPFFDRARAPTRFFLRFWPFFLPVPLVLLFYALSVRIGLYGVTPERYFLGLFGLVIAIVIILQFVPRLRGDIRSIAAVPLAALIIGSFGPQGALGVSLRSQADRFLEIVNSPPVQDKAHDEALAALQFLDANRELARVAPAGRGASNAVALTYEDTARTWGLDPQRPAPGMRGYSVFNGFDTAAYGVSGFDTVVQHVSVAVNMDRPISVLLPSGKEMRFSLLPDALVIAAGEQVVHFPMTADLIEQIARLDGTNKPAEIRLSAADRTIALMPNSIYADADEPRLESLQATILLHSQEWQ